MGITGELVRSVFSKNRSFGTTHDTNVTRNNTVERKRWASVRSYLCGDEFNSVLAQEDSASWRSSKVTLSSEFLEDCSGSARTSKATVFSSGIEDDSTFLKGSEASVTQPISENSSDTQEHHEKTHLTSEHIAAVVIQSAFRRFLGRRPTESLASVNIGDLEHAVSLGSPSKESIATSVEVQTGNSVVDVKDGVQHHKGARSQSIKLKEDWDDSTLSSNMSKMRIQNRLEASTRRERALAYAFSQQLRICSKKKHSMKSGNESEANMSWSWLERWMATRQHDASFMDISKQIEQLNGNKKLILKSRVLSDLAVEEKESCGSNEVSMHFDSISLSSKTADKTCYKSARNRRKGTGVSRQKTSPGLTKEHSKMKKHNVE